MGLWLSKLYTVLEQFSSSEPARIVMLGLDAAGKTTVLYKVKLNETITSIPTIGFNVETVQPCKGVTFTVWDVGGQGKIRQLWHHYYKDSQGLIYVVDSTDRERLEEAGDELRAILESDTMRGVPFVIMANKQDLPGAMKPSEMVEGLQLRSLSGHKWHIQSTCAVSGEGVCEGMDAMSCLVKEANRKHHT